MFSEEFKNKQQQQNLFSESGFKKDNGEKETLYSNPKRNKPEFKTIDPKSVNTHQKNNGGYTRPADALQVKQEAGGGGQQGTGVVQKKKQTATGEPSEDKYKKMTLSKEPLSMGTIGAASEKDEYYTKNLPKINFEVQFKTPVPEGIKEKLKAMAFYLLNKTMVGASLGDFEQNSITAFPLSGKDFDLTKLSKDDQAKYGGSTVFEYMRLENFKDGNTEKACIQIRELGQEKNITPDAATKQKQEEHFKKYFTLDASFADTKEIERLYNAVSNIPGSILGSIPVTPFKREDVQRDGAGNPNHGVLAQHLMNGLGEASITVYDSAFTDDGSMRYGDATSGFFGPFEQAIIHEIGHAFNGRKIKKAMREERAVADKYIEGLDLSIACADKKVKGKRCKGIREKVDKLRADDAAAEVRKLDARTETGYGYDAAADDMFSDKDANTAFRKALAKDGGKAITEYGAKEIEENYAELFSLYFIDEGRLKKMRPAIHEYFSTNYPK